MSRRTAIRGIVPVVAVSLLAGCAAGGDALTGTPVAAGPEEDGETACVANVDCEDTEYCATPVGQCEDPGTCAPRPEVCTMDWNPVCGCDGRTYANECGAAAAGENVRHRGECVEGEEPAG